MSMRTYEELLAVQTELAHFNPNHDKVGDAEIKAVEAGKAILKKFGL